MKEIICLSNDPWSDSPGRTQHLVTRLRDTKILFFEPADSLRDNTWKKPGRKVRHNVTVYTLPPVLFPDERMGHIFRLEQRRLARFIQEKAAQNRFRAPLLWTSSPTHVHLLDQLECSGLVYDCDREWLQFPGSWEGALANTADVVFAASPQLQERLSPCSSNIALVPNGVNFPLFAKQTDTRSHPQLSHANGPVLGWVGTVYPDLDLEPLLLAAQEHPRWTFLLVGRKHRGNPWLSQLRRCGNVISIPMCPLMEVPEYLAHCDVLLDFLRTSQPYTDIVPARIYEYLSTGKPIVSMLWPDQVERFPDVIYAASSPAEFSHLCARALEEDRRWVNQRRRNYGQDAAWSNRSAAVAEILSIAGLL